MKNKKIRKVMAGVLTASMALSGIGELPYGGIWVKAEERMIDTDTGSRGMMDASLFQEQEEGVYKVTMGENGYLTTNSLTYNPYGMYTSNENTPFSWDNVNMYFVMTDRFKNGDTSNDHSYGRGLDQLGSVIPDYGNREGYFHGGDLKGLTECIENGYFDALGTNAIWITAPYEQVHGALAAGGFKHYAYHGYYALDYTEVDANMGTAEDLEKFIDTAHEHGIRVIFDIVMNHAGYANPKDAKEFGYGQLASHWEYIYYEWSDNYYKWYNNYVAEAAKNGSEGMMDTQNGDWETNWWGSKWVRMSQERFTNYSNQAPESGEIVNCVDGLPDFVTEGTTDPGMPGILKKKWSSQKLAQEEKELDEFCKNYGMSKCVSTYLTKWLTDWVREYGVDGFRCDTVKYVNMSEWSKLKKAGVQALKEWRENNPDKPGAQWTDDFWMTGEDWGHGTEKNAYYSAGVFDSLINFGYQGNEKKSGAALEDTYSVYAQQINSDSSFNVLSYISSHDTSLGERSASAGTALLLTPGGVQTYYGDESGREGDGTHGIQTTRSNMNWSGMDESILSNWQKVGRFRRNHIAVGAGKHQKISDSPYTFSRTYTGKATVGSEKKTDYTDKVVVSLPGSEGCYDVKVSSVFEDGTTLVDSYSGEKYTVDKGTVSVTCDSNGVILLGEPTDTTAEANVFAKVTSGTVSGGSYSDDTITVKISAENLKDARVTVDGYVPLETENEDGSFEESISLVIGEATAYEETTTVKVTGISTIDGSEVTKEFKYTRSAEPKISGIEAKGLYLRVKKSDFDKAPQVYIYSGTGDSAEEYTAAWPGDALKEDGDYYVYSNDEITNEVYVIVHSYIASKEETPAWISWPENYDVPPVQGCIELKKGETSGTFQPFIMDTREEACKVTINYVNNNGEVIKSIYRSGEEGVDFTAYAPAKMYNGGQTYVFAGEKSQVKGTFAEKEQTITFIYGKRAEAATIPPTTATITPTQTPVDTAKPMETAEITASASIEPTGSVTPIISETPQETKRPTSSPVTKATNSPVVSATPIVTAKPMVSATPVASEKPKLQDIQNNLPQNTIAPTESPVPTASVKVGDTFLYKSLKYKVTQYGEKKAACVSLIGYVSSASNLKLASQVKYCNKSFQVVKIEKGALKNSKNLKGKITLPKYLVTVGDEAFMGCGKITQISIGGVVKKIGKKAFYNCKNVKMVKFHERTLQSVGKDAFKKLHKKRKLKVPKEHIEYYKVLLKNKY